MELLEPKSVEIECMDGTFKTFILSKFPAIEGRELITQYPTTAAPKVGDYKTNEELMLKLMCYVGIQRDEDTALTLRTRALVNSHVPDFECLMRLEWAMMEYNCSFFGKGKLSGILEGLGHKFQALIIKTLTDLKPS